MTERKYDSTVARIAGNIASGTVSNLKEGVTDEDLARLSVKLARAIVAEVKRTEPADVS